MSSLRFAFQVIFSLLGIDIAAVATSVFLERLLWALDGRQHTMAINAWMGVAGFTLAGDFALALIALVPAVRILRQVLRSFPEGRLVRLLDFASLPLHLCIGHVLVSAGSCAAGFALLKSQALPQTSGGAALVGPLSAFTVLSMAALPLYLALRVCVRTTLERVPAENSKSVLFLVERMPALSGRTRRRLLAALALPTAFVAMPLVLLVHFNAFLTHERGERSLAVLRTVGGTYERTTPSPLLASMALWVCAILGATATTVAALLGATWGKQFSRDVALATRELRGTGVADVLRGTRILRQAEFRAVRGLMQAVDELGHVFRRFASGQTKAIDAREATARMRGLFLTSMSHDLRAPLNAILGFTELALRHKLNPAQLESLSIIEQRGRELLALIQTILDSARAEVGELLVTPEWVVVGDVVMAAVSEAHDLFASDDVRLSGEVQPGLPKLYADSVRLVQALVALILVSTRILRRGEIRVRATLPSASEQVFFYVEADGRGGVHADERAKLFDALQDPEKGRQYGSVGLGLLLARAIFAAHGGGVHAETSQTGGVLFSAYVPTNADEVLEATSKGRLSARRLQV